jgi:hypothetical protein
MATIEMAVFSDLAPCSLVDIYQSSRGAYCVHCQVDENDSYSVDGDSKIFLNDIQYIPDYMLQYSKRHTSSYITTSQHNKYRKRIFTLATS